MICIVSLNISDYPSLLFQTCISLASLMLLSPAKMVAVTPVEVAAYGQDQLQELTAKLTGEGGVSPDVLNYNRARYDFHSFKLYGRANLDKSVPNFAEDLLVNYKNDFPDFAI